MKKRKSGWELESGSAEEKNNVKCDAGAAGCRLLAGRGREKGDGWWRKRVGLVRRYLYTPEWSMNQDRPVSIDYRAKGDENVYTIRPDARRKWPEEVPCSSSRLPSLKLHD